jgi:hypothetical protein
MSVLIVRGAFELVGAARYEARISYTDISTTLMSLVLNCRLRPAPWKAAPFGTWGCVRFVFNGARQEEVLAKHSRFVCVYILSDLVSMGNRISK